MADISVIIGEELAAYGFGDGHPFGPDRFYAFHKEYLVQGLNERVDEISPDVADRQTIELFHTHEYVERVIERSIDGAGVLDGGDTPAFQGIYEAAATVVGSSVKAAKDIMAGTYRRAMIPIAGLHHARRDSAAGFCVFNDCGVVIEMLLQRYGLTRIAYVDIDAHHGDGVFYAFEENPAVFFADIHEDGRFLYPGTGYVEETGKGDAAGLKLNLPAPPDARDDVFDYYWEKVESYLHEHRPEFILLQAGADSIEGDPITHMRFTPAAHAKAAAGLCKIADQYAQGRLLIMGGGGYNRGNLARGWTAVIQAILDC